MIPLENLNISLEDLALKRQKVIAQRPVITYAQALAQVERLKKTSNVTQSSKKEQAEHLKGAVCRIKPFT